MGRLKLLHINVNYIANKRCKIQHYLHENEIDIACFNETLHKNRTPYLQNYTIIGTPATTPQQRGTAIAYKSNLIASEIQLSPPLGESTGIQITTATGKKIAIISYYISPTQSDNLPLEFFRQLIKNHKHLIILGDLNAKSKQLGSTTDNAAGKALDELLNTEPVTCINNRQPTRYPYNDHGQPELLDYAIISDNLAYLTYNFHIGEDLQSDHLPILFELASSINKIPPPEIYNFKKTDWKIYRNFISANLKEVNPTSRNTIDEAADHITHIITAAIKEATPITDPNQRYKLPQHIIKVIRQCRQLRRIHQRTRNNDIKLQLNQLKRKIAKLIKDHYKSLFDNRCKQLSNEKDASAFWKTVNKITRTRNSATKIPNLIVNGNTISEDTEKAETFKDYFSTVHQIPNNPAFNLNALLEATENIDSNKHLYTPQPQLLQNPPIDYEPITIEELLSTIKKSRNSAPGKDGTRYTHV
ncbi:hypothetical protein HOLleu_35738 [Holothuria leucospilota]|uniref:Endonuclease/exonuclease/phosphatase domain-containing protein n=1 Tax=Holothuria leucospilota TaxID=206669 RepID=A0A9Q1BE65_HOLLE|nr:hypothetical protein HOLleu_35738 [Holothuria leucospilota]